MKAYVITTGTLFGLLALVHLWRIVEEGTRLAAEPDFIIATAVSAALCFWACRLLRHRDRRS